MKTISAVAALAIVGLVACQDATQPPVDDTSTLAVTASGTKKYWFSDYFPLIPGLYGIKTYEFTVGQTGQFTSQVVGTETVQYSTGAITGTRITFLGGILGGTGTLSVFRSEKRLLSPLRSLQDRVPSTTCGELVYPPDVSFGQVHDGMILDRRGVGNFEVNINDLNDCEELGFGDSFVDLIQIRDVHISGKRYNNAIVAWELEPKEYPGLRFRSLNLGGKEQEWGLTPLPTAAETNDWVVDDVVIYGRRVGILAVGLIEAETGGLNAAIELISVTRR